ncbi:hypothetical protein GCM10023324_42450 [Streptomyces youssoufiensis]
MPASGWLRAAFRSSWATDSGSVAASGVTTARGGTSVDPTVPSLRFISGSPPELPCHRRGTAPLQETVRDSPSPLLRGPPHGEKNVAVAKIREPSVGHGSPRAHTAPSSPTERDPTSG